MPSAPLFPTPLEYDEYNEAVPELYEEEEEDEPTTGGGAVVRTIRYEDDARADEPSGLHSLFDLRAGGRTDVGTKARANEDALLLLEGESLFVVADGMGGHAGGEVASQLAIEAIASTFVDRNAAPPLLLSNVPPRAIQLVQGFAAANEAIRSTASRNPLLSQMGTTVVATRFCPKKGRVYVGHVGDSRCYRLRGSVLEQITRDHTMAEYGVLGKDARRLSRAVGSNGIVEADLVVLAPHPGDVFLLCSDGLTKTLSESMIVEVLLREPDPGSAAQELIRLANQLRARDNVTAVVVRVTEKVQPSKAPPTG